MRGCCLKLDARTHAQKVIIKATRFAKCAISYAVPKRHHEMSKSYTCLKFTASSNLFLKLNYWSISNGSNK
jgi:hypothetical protein